jgi:hypothetical protein
MYTIKAGSFEIEVDDGVDTELADTFGAAFVAAWESLPSEAMGKLLDHWDRPVCLPPVFRLGYLPDPHVTRIQPAGLGMEFSARHFADLAAEYFTEGIVQARCVGLIFASFAEVVLIARGQQFADPEERERAADDLCEQWGVPYVPQQENP